ncbi:hypothetical protein [Pseudomonas sichuanensis]|uniref:hypothetical protein n=1 Tax=Pseudomonas sichuanensis TaxID=2213015 RepID=UPI00142D6B79|nr:hypothetical protein [Pseudomonas sichuanensis]
MLSKVDKEVINACMLDFTLSENFDGVGLIGVLIEKLLDFEGVGTEMSGVFLGCDADILSIPGYLDSDGFDMSFEYMDEYVVCSMAEGAKYIQEWCIREVIADRESVIEGCKRLVGLFGGMSDLTRTGIPEKCLFDMLVGSGLNRGDYIDLVLKSLLKCKGLGLGMSGIYLGCDGDSEGIPAYLGCDKHQMSFDFAGEYVVCHMFVGACYIRDWCEKNVCCKGFGSRRGEIMAACNNLMKLYEGFDDARQ